MRPFTLAAIAAASLVAAIRPPCSVAAQASYLVLESNPPLRLAGASGGSAAGAVIVEPPGSSAVFRKKHLGGVSYEPIAFQIAPGQAAMDGWLVATLQGTAERRNGSLLTVDSYLRPVSQIDFAGALVTEVAIATMDAANKAAGFLTVKIAPENTRRAAPASLPRTQSRTAGWLQSSFRFRIDGLDGSPVMRVDSLAARQLVVSGATGELRDYSAEPAGLEFSNLLITLPEARAADWYAWYDDFVVKGNNGDQQEKGFTIELLSSTLDHTILTINGFNAGIVAMRSLPVGAATIPQVQVELYVERLEFVAP